jgi:multidrug efflux system membrane fusion protein
VDIGNQISSGDTTGIVVITQTHPIDLVFTLPESDIATVVQAQKAGKGWWSKPGTAPTNRNSAKVRC